MCRCRWALFFFFFYPACSVWKREGNILAGLHKRALSSVSLGSAHAYLKMTQAGTRACRHALTRSVRQKRSTRRRRRRSGHRFYAAPLSTLAGKQQQSPAVTSARSSQKATKDAKLQHLLEKTSKVDPHEASSRVCVFHEASSSPPGPSLHVAFSGCFQPFSSLFCLHHQAHMCHMKLHI